MVTAGAMPKPGTGMANGTPCLSTSEVALGHSNNACEN
jgi:hypothetical protein